MSQIATLIANPANPVLTPELVAAISNAINSNNTYWLADGIACDCLLSDATDPTTAENTIRNTIGSLPVDVIIHQQEGRRCKALIADMDSTMIEQECIDELAAEAGLKEQVSKITVRAMNGEIEFEPALIERVELLKGLPSNVIEKVLQDRISLTPGGRELVSTMKNNGAYTALVSGGFTHFTRNIAKILGFHENQANRLIEQNSVLSGAVEHPILGREAKVQALEKIAREQGISPSEFIAVGDGANDLGMLQRAGTGVALHAKPKVAEATKFKINHGDLTALLYIQGYRKSDFVT